MLLIVIADTVCSIQYAAYCIDTVEEVIPYNSDERSV